MPIQYFEDEDEDQSAPAQEGILEDPDEDTVRQKTTVHALQGIIARASLLIIFLL